MKESCHQAASLKRTVSSLLHTVTLSRNGLDELFITAVPHRDGETFTDMFEAAVHVVSDAGATIVAQDVFGLPALEQAEKQALHDVFGEPDWPVTWLREGASAGEALTGTQIRAIAGTAVERIRIDGRVVGSVFADEYARYARLADLRSSDPSLPRARQARQTFEMMESAFQAVGMGFSDCVRTWLYLDDILDWYGEFNKVRDAFFRERNVFDGLVPASTGIGGSNAAGSAVIANAIAIQAIDPSAGAIKAFPLPSPLQCPALEYGSSFSRAVEVAFRDHRHLMVSGTASIEPGGKTACLDDTLGQIDLTMKVVAGILESRKMDWSDVTRAIAYIKDGTEAPLFTKWLADNSLPPLPMVTAENDICRPELLFEIEVDAIQADGDIDLPAHLR